MTTAKRTKPAPKKDAPKKPLSARQLAFAREYLVDLNGTKAVIRAGYSERGADVQAVRLLADARIKALIDQGMADRAERNQITADRVLQEVARLAFLDIRKAFKSDGTLLPLDQLDDDTAAAIAGLEVFEEYQGRGEDREFIGFTKKIKLADKKGSLELLMRHLGLLKDKVQLGVDPEDPLAALLRQVAGTSLKPRQPAKE